MSKLPTRDVQVFVAGAFALWGFRALIWLPSDFLAPIQSFVWFTRIAGAVVTGLALPLGVAILVGNRRAIFLTKIYLWLVLIVGVLSAVSIFYDKLVIGVPLSWFAVMQITGGIAPDLLVCVVLLWLLCSRRFRQTPNTALEPTATAPSVLTEP